MTRRFRIKEGDTINAYAVSPHSGKILSSIYDSGYSRIKQVEKMLISKIPYYAGKQIEIRITNESEKTFKSYTIKSNRYKKLSKQLL